MIGVVVVRLVTDIHVAVLTNGELHPLPFRASFIDRFAGFLTAGFVRDHGLPSPPRQPGSGVPSTRAFLRSETPRGAGLSLPNHTIRIGLNLSISQYPQWSSHCGHY